MTKVLNRRVDGQQYMPKGAVTLPGGRHFPRKESDWPPYPFTCNEALRNSRLRVGEKRGIGKAFVDPLKSPFGVLRPAELTSSTFVCRQQEVNAVEWPHTEVRNGGSS